MKKALTISLLALVTLASAAQASNTSLVNTQDLTGTQVKQLIQDKGSIVLSTGPGLYDRYVANESFCAPNEEKQGAYVPTKDSNSSWIGYSCVIDNNG